MLNPKVYNRHHKDVPTDAVYIGRGTPWGNHYSHQYSGPGIIKVTTREIAIESFEEDLQNNPRFKQQIKDMLKGKDLVCSCAPLPCHGDVLLRIANE